MRTRAVVIFLLTAWCWRAPLFAQATDSSSEAELRAVMAERRKASLEGDTEKIASSMADEYLQTDISGYVQDKTTWLKEYFKPLAELIKAGKFRWEAYEEKDIQLCIYGDTAVVIGSLELKSAGARIDRDRHTWLADPNAGVSRTLRFTRIYIRRNGKWLLAALHNAVPLPPPHRPSSGAVEVVARCPCLRKTNETTPISLVSCSSGLPFSRVGTRVIDVGYVSEHGEQPHLRQPFD